MLTLSAKIREIIGRKSKNLRKGGSVPAVLYGPKTKSVNIEIDQKEFQKALKEAGQSSLLKIDISGSDSKKSYSALIHELDTDVMSGQPIHVDFYVPSATDEITVGVPIIFEGESPAIKEMGGTLVKYMHEIEIKGLIQHLPKEIKIDISGLKSFEDHFLVGDLNIPPEVKVLKDPKDIVVSVSPPEKVEEELAKPVEEKVEEVKVVEKEKKEGSEELVGKPTRQ